MFIMLEEVIVDIGLLIKSKLAIKEDKVCSCIPEEWKNIIIKREEIITLCELVESEQHKNDGEKVKKRVKKGL